MAGLDFQESAKKLILTRPENFYHKSVSFLWFLQTSCSTNRYFNELV